MKHKPETYMIRATMVSLGCNIILLLLKAATLLIVNSLAIAIDLGISLVGLTVSVILYYSIKLANRPADLIHNYGYGKVEHVCEAMEGVVLIGIALAMSSQALLHIVHPKAITLPAAGFVCGVISSTLNFGGACYISRMAQKSKSPAIHAEAVHYKMEGFISIAIAFSFILSILMSRLGFLEWASYIDPMTALLVSGAIIMPSFKIAKRSFYNLLDASVEEGSQIEILKQLGKHINNYCEFRELKTRSSGRKKFIEFKLVVPEDISLRKGHEAVRALSLDITENIPGCEVTISMEPCDRNCSYAKNSQPCPYL